MFWGKAPEAGEFSRIFVLKVTLRPRVRLLLTVSSLQKKIRRAGSTIVIPKYITLLGGSPCFPDSRAYDSWLQGCVNNKIREKCEVHHLVRY